MREGGRETERGKGENGTFSAWVPPWRRASFPSFLDPFSMLFPCSTSRDSTRPWERAQVGDYRNYSDRPCNRTTIEIESGRSTARVNEQSGVFGCVLGCERNGETIVRLWRFERHVRQDCGCLVNFVSATNCYNAKCSDTVIPEEIAIFLSYAFHFYLFRDNWEC